MVFVILVWAGSSAWLGALTLRIERPPYTRKPLVWAVGSGVQISPGPPALAIFRLVFVFRLCVTRTLGDLLRARFSYFGSYNSTSTSPGIGKRVSNPHSSSLMSEV